MITSVDDDLLEKLADEAEGDYDVEEVTGYRTKHGRPRLGAAPSTVESDVHLD